MEFGVQVRGDWNHVLEVARWAEKRGLAAIALPDHYLRRGGKEQPAWDHLVHLAALAREIDLELVSLVSPVTFRHPAVLYKMGVTLDEVSEGRFTMGLGAGWLDEEFAAFGLPYPALGERMDMLEEAMAYIRAALTPGQHGFEGKHYRLEAFDPQPRPVNLRLAMGGEGGPRSRAIAARYADEYNLYACPPEQFRRIRDETRSETEAAGRDPDSIVWTSASTALAAHSDSDYRRLLEELAELAGQPSDRIEQVYEERGYPHGPGSKAAEMIAALEEAGCERFFPQIFVRDMAEFDISVAADQG